MSDILGTATPVSRFRANLEREREREINDVSLVFQVGQPTGKQSRLLHARHQRRCRFVEHVSVVWDSHKRSSHFSQPCHAATRIWRLRGFRRKQDVEFSILPQLSPGLGNRPRRAGTAASSAAPRTWAHSVRRYRWSWPPCHRQSTPCGCGPLEATSSGTCQKNHRCSSRRAQCTCRPPAVDPRRLRREALMCHTPLIDRFASRSLVCRSRGVSSSGCQVASTRPD